MYQAGKRFLFWVVYFPLGINILIYITELVSRTIGWLYSEPGSESSSVQHILDGGNAFDDFLRIRLNALILAVILGFGVWLYEYYSAKEAIKNETRQS